MTIVIDKNSNCKDITVKYYTVIKELFLSINDRPYEKIDFSRINKKDDYVIFKHEDYRCKLLYNGTDYTLYIIKVSDYNLENNK